MGLDTNSHSFYEDPLVSHSGKSFKSKFPTGKFEPVKKGELKSTTKKWWEK